MGEGDSRDRTETRASRFSELYLAYLQSCEMAPETVPELYRWIRQRLRTAGMLKHAPSLMGQRFQPYHKWDDEALGELAHDFYSNKLANVELVKRADLADRTPTDLDRWMKTVFTNYRRDLQKNREHGTNPTRSRIWKNLRTCILDLTESTDDFPTIEHAEGTNGYGGGSRITLSGCAEEDASPERMESFFRSLPEAGEITRSFAVHLHESRQACIELFTHLENAGIAAVFVRDLASVLQRASDSIEPGAWLLDHFVTKEEGFGVRIEKQRDVQTEREAIEGAARSSIIEMRDRLAKATHCEEFWRPDKAVRKLSRGSKERILRSFDFIDDWSECRTGKSITHGLNLALARHLGISPQKASVVRQRIHSILFVPVPDDFDD